MASLFGSVGLGEGGGAALGAPFTATGLGPAGRPTFAASGRGATGAATSFAAGAGLGAAVGVEEGERFPNAI